MDAHTDLNHPGLSKIPARGEVPGPPTCAGISDNPGWNFHMEFKATGTNAGSQWYSVTMMQTFIYENQLKFKYLKYLEHYTIGAWAYFPGNTVFKATTMGSTHNILPPMVTMMSDWVVDWLSDWVTDWLADWLFPYRLYTQSRKKRTMESCVSFVERECREKNFVLYFILPIKKYPRI